MALGYSLFFLILLLSVFVLVPYLLNFRLLLFVRLVLNQKAMIKNRDAIIDEQNKIVNKIKRILKADKIFTEKFDEIKELFEEANQTNSSNK